MFTPRPKKVYGAPTIIKTPAVRPKTPSEPTISTLLSVDTHSVSVIAKLPPPILNVVQQLEPSQVTAVIESSGYICVTVPSKCYVWQLGNKQFNQCIEYPLQGNLLATLVRSPVGSPGILICSDQGVARYWENVTFETFRQIQVGHIVRVLHIETHCLLFSKEGGIMSLNLEDLSLTHWTRTDGFLTRMTSFFGYSQDRSRVISGSIRGTFQKGSHVFVLSTESFQKWVQGNLLWDVPLHSSVKSLLEDGRSLTIDLCDIDYSDDMLLVLVSFSEMNQEKGHAIVYMKEIDQQLTLINFKPISLELPIHHSTPKLLVSVGVAFVVVNDRVIICSSELDSEFEETVPFSTTKIIGVSSRPILVSSDKVSLQLITMDPQANILQVDVSIPALISSLGVKEAVVDKTTLSLKSKIEQAVYYGGPNDWNPISFHPNNYTGDFSKACLEISTSILELTTSHFAGILDLSLQLNERLSKLEHLLLFLKTNNVLHLLSDQVKSSLKEHAERIAVGKALWEYHGELLSRDSDHPLLRIMNSFGPDIRDFYKYKLYDLESIILQIASELEMHSHIAPEAIYESNKVILIMMIACNSYRSTHDYQVQGSWTCQPNLIQCIYSLFKKSEKVLIELTYPEYPNSLKTLVKNQLSELGDVLLGLYTDRLKAIKKLESKAVAMEYEQVKSHIVSTLVAQDRKEYAFLLGEKYSDFKTLVQLSLQEPERIQVYFEKFGKDFANSLYDEYYKQKRFQQLLNDPHHRLLDEFLQQENISWLSWIHDIQLTNYDRASATLLKVADGQEDVDKQSLGICLAKLSALEALDEVDTRIYDAPLEYVLLQKSIKDYFLKVIEDYKETVASSTSIDPVQVVMQSLGIKGVLYDVVYVYISRLLDNLKLSPTEMIDVLTLQTDNVMFWVSSLEILLNYVQGHEFEFYLSTIWRRAWLADNYRDIKSKIGTCSDAQVQSILSQTKVFAMLKQSPPEIQLNPRNIILPPVPSSLYKGLEPSVYQQVMNVFESEQKTLEDLQSIRLDEFYSEMARLLE